MQNAGSKKEEKLLKILRIGSLIMIAVMLTLCVVFFRDATVKDIVNYTPDNFVLSVFVMLLFYALKSLSIMFPIKLLYASGGIIYPLWVSFIVNTLGIICTLSIPFFIGRYLGRDYADKLVEKYPKAKQIEKITTSNGFMFSFLIKIIGFFPCDISSMFLGAIGIKYRDFITGGTLGMIPAMIAVSILGENITNYRSPQFIVAVIAVIAISAVSALMFKILSKRQEGKDTK